MYEYRCKILRVVDGDTVDVDIDLGFGVWMHKERVRIYGLDTPESRTRDKVEKVFGNYAKQIVKDWLPTGSIQKLVTEKDKSGKYGRILGRFKIFDAETDREMYMEEWMISKGIGVAYTGQSKEEIKEAHLANRERLIKEGKVKL
tara:strand:- start:587 stop:1021 length:435 start_codon:yes stop_codon:yes gene_type:complete